jgi:hypothetical protein
MADRGGSGVASSAALRWVSLVAAVLVTALAVSGVVYGLTQFEVGSKLDRLRGPFMAAVAIALIGLPALFTWLNLGRILLGRPSAGWRVLKQLGIAGAATAVVGIFSLVRFAQFTAVAVLVCVLAAVGTCIAVLKRVLERDRVEHPPLNWHDRQQRGFVWKAAPWRFYRRVADNPKVAKQAEVLAVVGFTLRLSGAETVHTSLTAIAVARGTSVGAAADALADLEDAGLLRWDARQQSAELVGALDQLTDR